MLSVLQKALWDVSQSSPAGEALPQSEEGALPGAGIKHGHLQTGILPTFTSPNLLFAKRSIEQAL